MSSANRITQALLVEVLRDAHHYARGLEPDRPTAISRPRAERLLVGGRERLRDGLERLAARARFTHPHFDPELAGQRLSRIVELADGFDATYGRLGDEDSRRALLDVLKLRVLGPQHAPLHISPQEYRRRQAHADRALRVAARTYEVSDPYFSPLSLYQVPVDGPFVASLNSHSVDVVSVFLLGQYTYDHGEHQVAAQPGDVVLDIGGCWGDTALYFAGRVGPRGKVYTFEFDPESLEILRANLALNPELAERIEVIELALWKRSGEMLEVVQAGRMTSVSAQERAKATLSVPSITLDDFVAQHGLDRVDFVKMDVEGAELDVIAGGRQTLARFAPKLGLAAYHRDDDLVRIPEALVAAQPSYTFYVESFSPVEDETVLFGAPSDTALSSST
jgi:FkbM family methyltransferase